METIELLLWKSVKISIHDHEKQICLELITGCSSTFSCLSVYMREIFSFIEEKKKKKLVYFLSSPVAGYTGTQVIHPIWGHNGYTCV